MDALRQGVFRLLCTAILCALAGAIAGGTGGKRIVRFVSGILLTMVLLSILPGVDISKMARELLPDPDSIPEPVSQGEAMSQNELTRLIIQETEAYILHKAGVLGMDIRVDVFLSDGEIPVPESAVIHGEWTAQQKQELARMMETELAIPEEAQQWKG